MVVDSIKTFILYFINSKEPQTTATTTEPVPTTTMSTAIASSDDVQSLYTIVENGFKDNVSLELRFYNEYRSYSQQCATKFIWNSSALWEFEWFIDLGHFSHHKPPKKNVYHILAYVMCFFRKNWLLILFLYQFQGLLDTWCDDNRCSGCNCDDYLATMVQ